jgi:hypothetical protein
MGGSSLVGCLTWCYIPIIAGASGLLPKGEFDSPDVECIPIEARVVAFREIAFRSCFSKICRL